MICNENGWFKGTPISGNLHVAVVVHLFGTARQNTSNLGKKAGKSDLDVRHWVRSRHSKDPPSTQSKSRRIQHDATDSVATALHCNAARSYVYCHGANLWGNPLRIDLQHLWSTSDQRWPRLQTPLCWLVHHFAGSFFHGLAMFSNVWQHPILFNHGKSCKLVISALRIFSASSSRHSLQFICLIIWRMSFNQSKASKLFKRKAKWITWCTKHGLLIEYNNPRKQLSTRIRQSNVDRLSLPLSLSLSFSLFLRFISIDSSWPLHHFFDEFVTIGSSNLVFTKPYKII